MIAGRLTGGEEPHGHVWHHVFAQHRDGPSQATERDVDGVALLCSEAERRRQAPRPRLVEERHVRHARKLIPRLVNAIEEDFDRRRPRRQPNAGRDRDGADDDVERAAVRSRPTARTGLKLLREGHGLPPGPASVSHRRYRVVSGRLEKRGRRTQTVLCVGGLRGPSDE